MMRVPLIALAIVAVTAAAPPPQQRPDEYQSATGFAVELTPGGENEGWSHFTDALVSVAHVAASQDVKPNTLVETVAKFRMNDSSGNSASVEIRPCDDFKTAICLIMTAGELPKSFASWLKPTLQPKALVEARDLLIEIMQKDGKRRTFHMVRAFPQSFQYVDIAAEGNSGTVIRWTLEVRVDRIEMK